MKSLGKEWSVSICGDDMESTAEEVRKTVKAYLESELVTEASAEPIRVRSPSNDGKSKFELSIVVRYCKQTTLDEWLDEVMAEAIVGVGPGVVKIPKPPAKPV